MYLNPTSDNYKIGEFLPQVPSLEKVEWHLMEAEAYPIRLHHRQAGTGRFSEDTT